MDHSPLFGSAELAKLLTMMNQEGGFPISILTNHQGFPIASAASPDQDPERQSAVVALVQKTALQVRDQLGMAQMDEVSVYDKDGLRLVCRPFETNGYDLILAVLVPNKHTSYRKLTNKTVRLIRHSWKL